MTRPSRSSTSKKKISPPLRKRIIHAPVLPLIPPTIDDVVLETVHQAVATNKIISVSYQATYRNDPKEMNLHVWGLFQNAPSTYMIARKDGTKSPRFFALHRIKSIRLTTLGADIPKDFNISKMLNSGELHFGNEGLIELHLMVRPIIANILEQTPLSENQELSSELINWGEEEGILLKANVNLTWELRFWILSQGSNVEVIKPTKLRNSISKELRACVNRYQ